ncbi:MAG: Rpp14/Pop5 family protein [archaeon]|jgi:ribonuclease P/MRP protein subunit POP5
MKIEKKKKATIPLSQRERKRYILIEVLNAEVSEKDFYFGLWIELLSFFGSKGLAEINPKLVLYRENKGVLKCRRGKETELIAGLAFIRKVRNKKVIINTVAVSGTMRTLKEIGKLV